MKKWMLLRVLKFIALAIVAAALFGFVLMELWNILIPDIFHGPTITFWQAIGLLILSHILVRGPGGHFYGDWKNHRWKHKLEEKLQAMTPEEREKFKEEWRRRCGWNPDEKKD